MTELSLLRRGIQQNSRGDCAGLRHDDQPLSFRRHGHQGKHFRVFTLN